MLFFIDIPTRRVFFAGITATPTGAWPTQATRDKLTHRPTAHSISDPAPTQPSNDNGQQLRIIRATRCGGLINEYRIAA